MTQFKKILRITKEELEFLEESNKIEREYSKIALEDAITAWKYAKKYSKIIGKKYSYRKFTIEFILRIHKRLMKRLREMEELLLLQAKICKTHLHHQEESRQKFRQ